MAGELHCPAAVSRRTGRARIKPFLFLALADESLPTKNAGLFPGLREKRAPTTSRAIFPGRSHVPGEKSGDNNSGYFPWFPGEKSANYKPRNFPRPFSCAGRK
jgi:hypothetical protein